MKTISAEVNSKGEQLGTVDVQEFESIADAVGFFTNDETDGEVSVLALVNRQHRANVVNAERVRLTRGVNPMTALKQRIQKDPAAKAKLESLLGELGLI